MEDKNRTTQCPVTAMLQIIGGKWKPIILYCLTFGTKRFGEIAVRIPHISRKVLSEQLKQLEKDGLIIRKKYNETPPRVEYSLSDSGESLCPVLKSMEAWGEEHILSKHVV
ncbi:transcriptional regulator [Echinicola strongylocentroti]|uniref:Transcriptional regulator n=1 Tax=Echinicola strongylocentroti TaxID=1795355 RepID=A0A2Z4IQ33_9BACT|nr:helix-turn-helix domain-containing protein [Echinicola strongylocentroti]AWW32809.1 transcriptional regulator [Echinicola strongylocentroti]